MTHDIIIFPTTPCRNIRHFWHLRYFHKILTEISLWLSVRIFFNTFCFEYFKIKKLSHRCPEILKPSQMSDPANVPIGCASLPYALSWTILKCQGEIFELFVFVGSLHHPDVLECVALIELYLQRMVINGVFLSFLSNSGSSAISVNGKSLSNVKMYVRRNIFSKGLI